MHTHTHTSSKVWGDYDFFHVFERSHFKLAKSINLGLINLGLGKFKKKLIEIKLKNNRYMHIMRYKVSTVRYTIL